MAFTVLGLASGCNQNKDTGTVVTTTPTKSPAEIQQEIQQVQSNPSIPAGQKQAFIGRLQSQLPGAASETEARKASKNPQGGQAVPGKK